jgi:aldose 1-epimerase
MLTAVDAVDGFTVARIASAGGELEAEFVPGANMLCHSLRRAGVERLYQRYAVRAYAQQGKTTGIPLLHPWANRLSATSFQVGGKDVRLPEADGRYELDGNGLPRHGALPSLMRWEVDRDGADRLTARLRWGTPELLELFPFEHELRLDAIVSDDELRLVTVLRATGEDEVPVAFGYHPYLRVPDIPRAQWDVALGAAGRLVLDERMIPTGETEPLARREFRLADQSWDDGLTELSNPPRFSVQSGGRGAAVVFGEGYSWAQVYAPPSEDCIAFEPMTAPTNALVDHRGLAVIAPGAEYRAEFAVALSGR